MSLGSYQAPKTLPWCHGEAFARCNLFLKTENWIRPVVHLWKRVLGKLQLDGQICTFFIKIFIIE